MVLKRPEKPMLLGLIERNLETSCLLSSLLSRPPLSRGEKWKLNAQMSFQGWRKEQIFCFFFPHVLWIRPSKACGAFSSEGGNQSFER